MSDWNGSKPTSASGTSGPDNVNPVPASDATSSQPADAAAVRVVPSSEILQGAREVIILHDGQTYRLRRTKNGKLILNK